MLLRIFKLLNYLNCDNNGKYICYNTNPDLNINLDWNKKKIQYSQFMNFQSQATWTHVNMTKVLFVMFMIKVPIKWNPLSRSILSLPPASKNCFRTPLSLHDKIHSWTCMKSDSKKQNGGQRHHWINQTNVNVLWFFDRTIQYTEYPMAPDLHLLHSAAGLYKPFCLPAVI